MTAHRTVVQLVALTVVALAGLAAAVLAVLAIRAQSKPRIEIDSHVLVNDPGQIEAHNSPDIARRGDTLVVVHRLDRPGFDARIQSSVDGGHAWLPAELRLPDGLDRPFAPDASFGRDGRLFVSYVNLTGPGNVPDNVWVASSDNDGATFELPTKIAGSLAFQVRSTVDPVSGAIYVTWLQASEVGLLRFAGEPPRVMLTRSLDGGATFDPPITVNDESRTRVGAAVPVVMPNSDVIVVYVDFEDDIVDFENLDGPPHDSPFTLLASRSSDRGQSFSAETVIDDSLFPTRRFLAFLPEFPSVAVDPSGTLWVAWADGRNGDLDVFLARSDDGAASWSEPVRVNDNPLDDGTSQYLPAIDAIDGRVDVIYYDRAADVTDTFMETTFATSEDGRTFDRAPASPIPFDSTIGSSAAGHLEPDFGSRLSISSNDDGAFAVWTDTQLGSTASGRQDIVGARVTVNTTPSPIVAFWPTLLALVVGLVGFFVWRRNSSVGATPSGR